jgi:hypothetical protein
MNDQAEIPKVSLDYCLFDDHPLCCDCERFWIRLTNLTVKGRTKRRCVRLNYFKIWRTGTKKRSESANTTNEFP